MKINFPHKLLNLYMYLPVVALLVGLYIVFFAEDKFRYECQDPAMWSDPWCNPPLCLSVGACTSDLLSLDGSTFNRYKEQIDLYNESNPPTDPVLEEASTVEDEPAEIISNESENATEEISPAEIDNLIRENKANE